MDVRPRLTRLSPPPRHRAAGLALTLLGLLVTTAVLVPARSSINQAAAALVLLVPVVAGVAVGGFPVAPVGVITGFLTYDFFFIPPYRTLRVAADEHWVDLGAYAVVGLVVGGVVAQVQRARAEAERREAETRVLHELSEAAAREESLDGSLRRLVDLARELLDVATAAVLTAEPGGAPFRVVACAGEPLPALALRSLADRPLESTPVDLPGATGLAAVGWRSAAGPRGVLAVAGRALSAEDRRSLSTFAGQTALAVDRSRLAEEASRTRTLVEVDRLRSALVGSVSHDLRTPLASIKASISALADPGTALDDDGRITLMKTIEQEADRLDRFVANLLDFSRIEAGALDLRVAATPLAELIGTVVSRLGTVLAGHPVRVAVPEELPLVQIDYLLVDQVFSNLLENAARHGPPGTPIEVEARAVRGWVEVRVRDHGPGIPADERERIFELFYRLHRGMTAARPSHLGGGEGQSHVGMGLAICAGVVEAHGGQIWVEQPSGGGATFAFRLPVGSFDAERV